mmetsp:Transcript_5213/g.22121  ORF Transcript_5213/g.22121 Transcript_5213/m.22121 type:complete len:212 (-) Transcript_5213:2293-2928(-)
MVRRTASRPPSSNTEARTCSPPRPGSSRSCARREKKRREKKTKINPPSRTRARPPTPTRTSFLSRFFETQTVTPCAFRSGGSATRGSRARPSRWSRASSPRTTTTMTKRREKPRSFFSSPCATRTRTACARATASRSSTRSSVTRGRTRRGPRARSRAVVSGRGRSRVSCGRSRGATRFRFRSKKRRYAGGTRRVWRGRTFASVGVGTRAT